MNAYTSTTQDVTVSVEPTYLASESAPEQNLYVWAYKVRIKNNGAETLQLKTRHWKITDGFGRLQEVIGPGVVGLEPIIKPGDSFEYTSGTPLSTPSGIMAGVYAMQKPDGNLMDINIPAFSLDAPGAAKILN